MRGRGKGEGTGQKVAARRERIEGGCAYRWDQRFSLASGWKAAVSIGRKTGNRRCKGKRASPRGRRK